MENQAFKDTVTTRLYGPNVRKFDRKRIVVLEAFIRSLAERGLADTSYASVANILEMKPAHVAYYFSTWESMLEGAFRLAIHTAQEITIQGVVKAKNPLDKIRAIVYAPFEHFHRFPHHRAVLSAYHMQCIREPKLRAAHREVREVGNERIRQILSAHFQKALSQSEQRNLATAIQHCVVGSCIEWITLEQPEKWTTAAKQTWGRVESLIESSHKH